MNFIRRKLKQRFRKRDEPLTELAQDINRLTRMAYPSADQGLRDTLAKDCFIESLNDVELELFVCQKEPDTLDDAVRVALKFEAFFQSRRKRHTAPKSGVRMQHGSYDECDVTSNDIREIKAALTEIQQKSAQQANTETGGGVISAMEIHIFSDAAHIQEGETGIILRLYLVVIIRVINQTGMVPLMNNRRTIKVLWNL